MMAVIGDYYSSGLVDSDDYDVWKNDFGSTTALAADGNRDFVVDAADYTVWRDNLGKTAADFPPTAPQNVNSLVSGPSSVSISWNAVSGATSYRVERRTPELSNDDFETLAPNETGTSYSDTTVTTGVIYEYRVIAINASGESQPSAASSVKAGSANLTAFRQQQFHDPDNLTFAPIYAPFAKAAVAEVDEENVLVGPGIRINFDDDNGNGLPDRNESGLPIVQENDLIEVRIDRLPGQGPLVLEPGFDLGLNYSYDKSTPVPFDDDVIFTEPLPFVNDTITVFVEWVSLSRGTDFLNLVDPATSMVIDTLVFHTFHSIVVVLGGEGQVPNDPVNFPNDHGIFDFAIGLYRGEGYDVRMYDEDNVEFDGSGLVFDEIANSVNHQMFDEIAILGYSHGGGSTFELSQRLSFSLTSPNPEIVEPFSISLTAYIDAIEELTPFAERRRPPSTQFHVNQYQRNLSMGFLNGNTSNGDDDIDRSALGVVHSTIDDNSIVLDLIRTRLLQLVTR